MRRRTLVDRLERRIAEAEPLQFDWMLEVRLACQRQDMAWELRSWDEESVRLYGEPGSQPVPTVG